MRFHANVMRCGMKRSGPGFKAAAGIGCTNTLQRVVVGNFIESTAAADWQHRHDSLGASGKWQRQAALIKAGGGGGGGGGEGGGGASELSVFHVTLSKNNANVQ